MKALLVALSFLFPTFAQSAVYFELATIKPTPPSDVLAIREAINGTPRGFRAVGDRIEVRRMPLRYSIGIAYAVRPRYVFGEKWLDTEFDIVGKLPAGASLDRAPEMLQTLLAERFGLKAHPETRQEPVFALTLAKGGLKLNEAEPGAMPNGGLSAGVVTMNGPLEEVIGAAASFAGLPYPLVNQTGLSGKYRIPMPVTLVYGGTRDAVDDSDALSRMREAVAPLGLEISRTSATIPVMVVDHIEHTPTEN